MSKAADKERDAIIGRLVESLRKERLRQNRSMTDVAAAAGLDRTMVMRIEKRQREPTIGSLLRISDALGADLSVMVADATRAIRG